MPITIPVYSEQPMTADAMNIIQNVLADYPPNTFTFQDVTEQVQQMTGPNSFVSRLLIFGSPPKVADLRNCVYTISVAQVMTKANAVSVLKAALNQFYLPQKQHPKKPGPYRPWHQLDPQVPTAIDIETSGNLDDTLPEDVEIINVSFYQESKFAYINKQEWEAYQWPGHTWNDAVREAVKYFENPIWHNGKFDLRVIEGQTGFRPAMYFDTMLAHHVLNQAAGDHKLKHLARQYLGAPEWEGDLKKYTVGGAYYERIPKDLLIQYNTWDVYWTYELWKFLEPQLLSDDASLSAYMLEMSASDFLLDVEQKGFAVDVPYAEQLSTQMQVEVDVLLNTLQGMVNDPNYNPGSWQQTQKHVGRLIGAAYGGSTDEKSLLKLKGRGQALDDFIDTLLEYRGVKKALSTYVDGALKRHKDGRVHTTFLIHGTTTGRLSSTGPNIQNIPRDKKFRSLYIG